MKNIATRAVVLSVVLLIATFTQPAAALPRYAFSDTYYAADMYEEYGGPVYCISYENGHNSVSCGGARDQSGTLEGRFRYSYQYECSSGNIVDDGWYFYSDACGGKWIAVDGSCHQDRCYSAY